MADEKTKAGLDAWSSTVIVSPAPISMKVTVLPPMILVRSHFWINWLEIAIKHEAIAHRERGKALAAKEADSSVFSQALLSELHASMVTVTAASNAVDALTWALDLIKNPQKENQSIFSARKPGQMIEAIKAGFVVGPAEKVMQRELKWLYELRGNAVHFVEKTKETVLHPTGTNTAPENVDYSAETSARAVDVVMQMLDLCIQFPRCQQPAFVKWATDMQATAQRLREQRHAAHSQ